MNDDKNIRALFERALSSLPAEASAEVRFFICEEQRKGRFEISVDQGKIGKKTQLGC